MPGLSAMGVPEKLRRDGHFPGGPSLVLGRHLRAQMAPPIRDTMKGIFFILVFWAADLTAGSGGLHGTGSALKPPGSVCCFDTTGKEPSFSWTLSGACTGKGRGITQFIAYCQAAAKQVCCRISGSGTRVTTAKQCSDLEGTEGSGCNLPSDNAQAAEEPPKLPLSPGLEGMYDLPKKTRPTNR